MTVIVFLGIKLLIFESRFFFAKNDISDRRQDLSTLITYSPKIQYWSFFGKHPIFYRRKGLRRNKICFFLFVFCVEDDISELH